MADDLDLKPEDNKDEDVKKEEDVQKEADVKVQEQIDSAVEEKISKAREEWQGEQEKKTEPQADEKSYVDPSWQPKGWDKVFDKSAEIGREVAREEFKKIRDEEKEEMDKINEGFDNQLSELRKGGADINKSTEKEIFQLGVKLGSTNIKEIYNVYETMKAAKKDTETERTLNLAKRASKVSSGGAPEKGKPQKSYADIAGKSMDALIDEEFGDE